LPHENLSRSQLSHIDTFINTVAPPLMGRLTVTSITSWHAEDGIQAYLMPHHSVELLITMLWLQIYGEAVSK